MAALVHRVEALVEELRRAEARVKELEERGERLQRLVERAWNGKPWGRSYEQWVAGMPDPEDRAALMRSLVHE